MMSALCDRSTCDEYFTKKNPQKSCKPRLARPQAGKSISAFTHFTVNIKLQ